MSHIVYNIKAIDLPANDDKNRSVVCDLLLYMYGGMAFNGTLSLQIGFKEDKCN